MNQDDLGFCEVFAQMGKTGGCASSQIESTGRLISLALRSGVNIDSVIKQITGIRCPSPNWQNGCQVLSCPDAIAKVLANVAQIDQPESHHGHHGLLPRLRRRHRTRRRLPGLPRLRVLAGVVNGSAGFQPV